MDNGSQSNREQDLQHREAARRILRQWLLLDESALRSVSAPLGQGLIEIAAEASARLSRNEHLADPEQVLSGLVDNFSREAGSSRQRGSWWRRQMNETRASEPSVEAMIQYLTEQRDFSQQALMRLRSDRNRLAEADTALQDFGNLLTTLLRTAEAGAREIAGSDPRRSSILREAVLPGLLERQRDIVTQVAVTRQGVMSLDLLIETQERLSAALDRARTATVAAIRTATNARKALKSRNGLNQSANALASRIEASEARAATENCQNPLDIAIGEARAALAAPSPSSDPSDRQR